MVASRDNAAAAPTVPMSFDARVQPFWLPLKDRTHPLGFFESWKRKRHLTTILRAINAALQTQSVGAANWDQSPGECLCNLRVDRMGVLQDLRTFAARQDDQSATEVFNGNAESRFRHLIKNRDRSSFYIPIDFAEPFMIHDPETRDLVPVGSSVRLRRELTLLNKDLKVEETFQIKKMVDFLQATAQDIARYEVSFANDPLFWVKFGYVLLDKLAQKSIQSRLPIVFG